MTKISEIAENWQEDADTRELPLKNGESVDIYVLEKLDWAEINKRTGKDVWKMLLNIYDAFGDMSKEEYEEMSEEERQTEMQQAGIDFLKEIGFEVQVLMFWRSFYKDDPEVTPEQTSKILAYQIPSHVSEMEYLQFMLGGMSKDEVEEEVEPEVDEKKSKPSQTTES